MKTIQGNIYDYPKYYDLLFGSDWKAEYDFLRGCFSQYAGRKVRRLFEPACGTGRLLVKLAQAGYSVAGNDLNPKAVAFCNARLVKHGFRPTAQVGDMADFALRRKVDAAFNTINSFRHLQSEAQAAAHLRCVAEALNPGGLYILGLHLTPRGPQRCTEESWSARRGHLGVTSRMRSTKIDRQNRVEWVRLTFEVYTPRQQFRLEDQFPFRTYSAPQFDRLLAATPQLEVAETYDFAYRLDEPVEIDGDTEDVVYVLRRR